MTQVLITPDELPAWVPGRLTIASPDDGWDGVAVRGYHYEDSDVAVPPMRDYVVVAYRQGATSMHRRLDSAWSHERLGPGDVSLLTRAADSHWTWSSPIDVVHVYLTHDQLASTCRQMYEREVADVELHDTIKADDPEIHRTAMAIAHEAAQGGPGASLLVDALTCQLSVTILRRHANVLFREPGGAGPMTFRQEHAVREYVQAHLHRRLSLDELADAAGLSKPLRPVLPRIDRDHAARVRAALPGRSSAPHGRAHAHSAARGGHDLRLLRPEPHEPAVPPASRGDTGPDACASLTRRTGRVPTASHCRRTSSWSTPRADVNLSAHTSSPTTEPARRAIPLSCSPGRCSSPARDVRTTRAPVSRGTASCT